MGIRFTTATISAVVCASAAHASITLVTGDGAQIAPPASSFIGAIPNTSGALFWDEQQGVSVSGVAVDLFGPGTLFTDPAGLVSGTVDSHFLHVDVVTGATFGGMVTGTVVFSKPIVGVCVLDSTLGPTDLLLGNPSTLYPTGDAQRNAGVSLGGAVTVSGSTLAFSLLYGGGEYQQLRILTAVPAPGAAVIPLIAGVVASRRRRR